MNINPAAGQSPVQNQKTYWEPIPSKTTSFTLADPRINSKSVRIEPTTLQKIAALFNCFTR